MKHNIMLIIASLLSILFVTFHLTDDIVRGMEPGRLLDLIAGQSWSSGFTARWCWPKGDRGTSSSLSGRSLGWSSPSFT
jgi:hypothetical protein